MRDASPSSKATSQFGLLCSVRMLSSDFARSSVLYFLHWTAQVAKGQLGTLSTLSWALLNVCHFPSQGSGISRAGGPIPNAMD